MAFAYLWIGFTGPGVEEQIQARFIPVRHGSNTSSVSKLRRWEIAKVFIFRGIDNWINGLGTLIWYANDVVLNELLGTPSCNYVTPYG